MNDDQQYGLNATILLAMKLEMKRQCEAPEGLGCQYMSWQDGRDHEVTLDSMFDMGAVAQCVVEAVMIHRMARAALGPFIGRRIDRELLAEMRLALGCAEGE